MIKRLLFIILIQFTVSAVFSQNYGNEWINYSQPYYRIYIPTTGIYRISYNTLVNAGIPVSTINPKNFQLFLKGQEQYITVFDESDNVFNPTDYIEFYATKNDALSDSSLYEGINRLPNPYVALFNDTNCVFLTWNNSVSNKRMQVETDINFAGYTPADYFYAERLEAYNASYSVGRTFLDVVSDPRYVRGEGFGNNLIAGTSLQTSFSNLNVYQSSSLPAYIKTHFSGSSERYIFGITYDHEVKVEYLDNSNNTALLTDTTFFSYNQIFVGKQIPSSQLQDASQIKVSSIYNPLFNTYAPQLITTNVHYISLKYPQKTDLMGQSQQQLFIGNNAFGAKSFYKIKNVNIGSNQVLLYDLTNHKKINTVTSADTVSFLIPNSIQEKVCYLTTSNNIISVNTISAVNQTGYFTNYKTTNTDSAFVIVTHTSLKDTALMYKQYRESTLGGANHVILADVNDLYDQFAYGNIKNPHSIKNFCRFLSDSLPVPPKYLLLIGKSIKNNLVRASSYNWNACKVPSLGTPPSDNYFTTRIKNANTATPFIPVGRISASTGMDVYRYLNKVKEQEGTSINGLAYAGAPPDWHKRVLHFSGGEDAAQQSLFKAYLQIYADTIEDVSYGARVFPFQKTTTAPIQITISDSIKQLIDYGCSLITFFGHGSTTGFDQAIDNPYAYDNFGKYPLFLANSCYSGDIHLPGASSASEAFTLIENRGSIGFLASSSAGVVNTLFIYSKGFYRSLAGKSYHKGIGDAIKQTCSETSILADQLQGITGLEMTLEGDPSVKLNAFSKPDYEITNASVYFNTTTYQDSIGINIVIKNNAKAIHDTLAVRIGHQFPNGDSTTYFKIITAPFNCDTLSFFIYKDLSKFVGLNHFNVFIDFLNAIDELSEMNNKTTSNVDLFIPGGDILPVYPYKYAIIPNTPQVVLKASTANPFASATNYRFQLDTTDLFTSPINSAIINSVGGVVQWTVNLPFGDTTVYYWRVCKDTLLPDGTYNWKESSFEVHGTKNGWGQSHFFQFKEDKYQFVNWDRPTRKFNFKNTISSINCRNAFHSALPWTSINYSINNYVMHLHPCVAFGGWSVAIFDSISAQPFKSSPLLTPSGTGLTPMNNCQCYNYTLYAFDYGVPSFCGPLPNWKNDLYNLLDTIRRGTMVLAYSNQNHQTSTFSPALKSMFNSIGSQEINTVTDTVPIIIFGRKGMTAGQAHEIIGSHNRSIIELDDSLKTSWDNGFIASEIIGPSLKWNSLHWRQQSVETVSTDSLHLKIVRIKLDGTRDTVPVVFPKDSTDIYDLSNYVDASVYPKIQLVLFARDNIFKTSVQLKSWRVYYDPVPECAINPQVGFANNASLQAIQQGDNLIVKIPIENIGQVPFNDSLVVTYWIEDANRNIHPIPQHLKAKPFVPAQVIIDTLNFNTYDASGISNYAGFNYLWIDVNPETNSKYQLEQYHFNNVARIGFDVSKDNINPLLDVTFDGTHILNGDIISSKPTILITLKDENKFLALNDTSNFKVFIRYPNQASDKRIYFKNGELLFTPAQLPNNSCKIEYRPEFPEDGKYRMIVQASDRSSNVSGAIDYSIQFEIVNKQTVTEVLNYPNPFSTSTRFVFTLTGSEIPDVFTIQIMTITGKVVREITKSELGNLHIGRNITDYAWDGKDEFGDKLANGVYLYKVITRSNGKAVEKRESDVDSFFKKGFGKMVIMR